MSPSSGVLATIVSQDPMYVVFPISVRTGLELRERYADKGGFNAVVIRIRLPDGRMYGQTGKLDFVDNTVSASTDTIILRGTIPNPLLTDGKVGDATVRELVDGEFVSVVLEGVQPVQLLTVPRSAVLSDQQGDYVYTVDAQNKVQQARIQLGQSSPTVAAVLGGLSEGAMVITDGVQKVHPGQVVSPGPASPPVGASPAELRGAAATAPASGTANSGTTNSGTTNSGTPSGAPPTAARPTRMPAANDLLRLHRPAAPGHRHRHRHHHRRRAGDAAHSGRAVARHRAAAGDRHRHLSRRLGQRCGKLGRPADRGPDRRRRQDAVYEVEQRQ